VILNKYLILVKGKAQNTKTTPFHKSFPPPNGFSTATFYLTDTKGNAIRQRGGRHVIQWKYSPVEMFPKFNSNGGEQWQKKRRNLGSGRGQRRR
jgi:hypothetical protein